MNEVRLTRALTLEAPAEYTDGSGGILQEWETQGTLWAEMRPRTGRGASGEEVSLSRAGWRVTVRAAPYGAPSRPVPGQRFREGERLFEIVSVAESGPDARYLVCMAEEERVR